MSFLRRFSLLSGLFALGALTCAGAEPFHVVVDVSAAPNAKPYAEPVKKLFEEWYVKIDDLLFGTGASLPFQEVRVIFERKTEVVTDQGPQQAPAYSKANIVHANFQAETRFDNAYRAMLIHELVHVCQNYTGLTRSPARWVGEGIADYVRHRYFEKDLLAKLEWDSDGTLKDSPLERAALQKEGYRIGYTIAAPFLYWLELHKNPRIVAILSQAVRDSRYSPGLFKEHCGDSLDTLWQAFFEQK
jgi:hypothetical protein